MPLIYLLSNAALLCFSEDWLQAAKGYSAIHLAKGSSCDALICIQSVITSVFLTSKCQSLLQYSLWCLDNTETMDVNTKADMDSPLYTKKKCVALHK